jgi:diadenosine tetraphosphate (Ap4A) HIT family hydrolase
MAPERVREANERAFVVDDAFPVSPGHTLILPKRHAESVFDLTAEEATSLLELVQVAKARLDHALAPAGYNIGVNVGKVAGQTILHAHVHLIPRYSGDLPNPVGGVRNIIPGKGPYESLGGKHE